MKNADLVTELEQIRLNDPEGKLRPEAVLEAARPITSPLHSRFEWDDGEAADRWRLHQARQLIRVAVTVLPNTNEPVRVYVSLTTDRRNPDDEGTTGGYRNVQEVMSHEQLQRILISDALAELRTLELKYSKLTALADVFNAAREAREQHAAREQRRSRRKKKAKKKTTTKKKASTRRSNTAGRTRTRTTR
jgi:hypothetical protein